MQAFTVMRRSGSAQRTAPPMRGVMRRKRKGHSGALRGYCPLTQSPGQQAEPSGAGHTAKPVPWGTPCTASPQRFVLIRLHFTLKTSPRQNSGKVCLHHWLVLKHKNLHGTHPFITLVRVESEEPTRGKSEPRSLYANLPKCCRASPRMSSRSRDRIGVPTTSQFPPLLLAETVQGGKVGRK